MKAFVQTLVPTQVFKMVWGVIQTVSYSVPLIAEFGLEQDE